MSRLSGPLLMATGVLDLLYVLIFHSRQLATIAHDGFLGAVELDPARLMIRLPCEACAAGLEPVESTLS